MDAERLQYARILLQCKSLFNDLLRVRGADDGVKPGVERSETPGSSPKFHTVREAADGGCDYEIIIRDDSTVGRSAGFGYFRTFNEPAKLATDSARVFL